MDKTFYSDDFERNIEISITQDEVLFIFNDPEFDFQFYDFGIDQWKELMMAHMATKGWFTQEMADFITYNIPVC